MPLVTSLCRRSGKAGKIALAKGLLRAVGAFGPVCPLLDAWYRRGSLIRTALRLGHEVIGQVRRDTALFALPPQRKPGTLGRPRLYGARLDADAVAALPVSATPSPAMPAGRPGCATPRVARASSRASSSGWSGATGEISGSWAKARLLLSTDPTLSAPAIVEACARG